MKFLPILIFLIAVVAFVGFFHASRTAADATPTPTPSVSPSPTPDNSGQIHDIENQINDLEGKISQAQGQEKTLSSQISVLDNQIALTQLRIRSTEQQITDLTLDIDTSTKKIASLEGSITDLTKVLLNRIVTTYEVGSIEPLQVLASSSDLTNFFQRANYLRVVQAHDKELLLETMQAKANYANEKDIFEQEKKKVIALQKTLESYTTDLTNQQQAKKDLLTQTQGSEANYQRLLAQARAQLAGFQRFAESQGGSSILSGQTSCDGWGCYYNQRDSQWGDMLINGQSGYSMAGYGCLITSIAMVLSHMGHTGVTPSDIAQSDPGNFAVGTAMLRYSINVKGLSISRIGAALNTALQGGPVIVGIYAFGGTHFVVIKTNSNGTYIMNDPFVPNGHDISFTDHYSLGSIFEVDTVSVS